MTSAIEHSTTADLRFPIGRYKPEGAISAEQIGEWISDLEALPQKLRDAVSNLTEWQLNTPYRPGGWTVRQVVHHLPDSHINSYVRFRLALTESNPVIKPYEESLWAELKDARTAPVEASLILLDGLHQRFTALLRTLEPSDFAKTFRHPDLGEKRLDWTLGLYAWHSRHHVAHIRSLRMREGW